MNEILIVVVEPNKKPYAKMMQNDLAAMNEIVGGYIELINVGRNHEGNMVALTVNEEGKLQGLPVNRRLVGFDTLVGNFFITAYDLEGENVNLTEAEAEHFIKRFTPVEINL